MQVTRSKDRSGHGRLHPEPVRRSADGSAVRAASIAQGEMSTPDTAPPRRAAVLVPVGQLLLEQRQVRSHPLGADGELHHAQHVVVARRRRRPAAAVAVAGERREGQLARGGLLLLVEPALGHGEVQRIGPQLVAQQRQVARQVGERRKQRRDLGLRDDDQT